MNTYCPYHRMNIEVRGHFLVDSESTVPVENMSSDSNKKMPNPPKNAGLYSGPQMTGPDAPIPVTPTATNLVYNNLRSANPPPGAIQQAVGTDRLGNNFTPKPEVMWYNPDTKEHHGKYKMMGV